MCGRFALYSKLEDIKKITELIKEIPDIWFPNYNVTPGLEIPVIVKSDRNRITRSKWGFKPQWKNKSYNIINLRSETVMEKPFFKKNLLENRGIILANGFYEWDRDSKQPYYIKPLNNEIFYFGCLLLKNNSEKPDDNISSAIILTTEANKKIKAFHDRMPIIINDEQLSLWLNMTSPKNFSCFFEPLSGEEIELYPISKAVNSPKNNGPDLIRKI